jgi:hypothetical protein
VQALVQAELRPGSTGRLRNMITSSGQARVAITDYRQASLLPPASLWPAAS